ncbi:MAG: ABC transporter permease [Brooklawnia sp.]|uniref:ABC transporter permease n=1 Tax=Brooklawnia sp. TaxID=2699740 RepID=UPI003C744A3E
MTTNQTLVPSSAGPSGASAASSERKRLGVAGFLQAYGALTALVILFIYNAITSPNFLTVQSLVNVQLRQAAPVAIVALGMALVIATGGIDLSVGSVMAIAGQIGALSVASGMPAGLAILLALAASLVVGLFNGTLVSRFGVQPIIATLIMFIAGRGIAQLLTMGQLVTIRNEAFGFLGLGRIGPLPFQVVVFLLIWLAVALVVRYTAYGRYLIATGANEPAARLAGVPVHTAKLSAYAVAAGLAGLVGLIEVSRLSGSDANNTGMGMELDAIAAVAVAGTPLAGGRLTPTRVVIGAVMLRLLQNTMIAKGLPREAAQIAQGLIIIAAIIIQRRSGGKR